MRIVCENCGKNIEITSYRSTVFCPACNSKIEAKNSLSEDQTRLNDDNYLKAKTNLMEAYIGRKIDEIMFASKDVLRIVPDDFWGRFLYAFCMSKRGNNQYLISFFQNCNLSLASDEEINLVLKEITSSTDLHNQKCEFINKLEECGIDTAEYSFYYQQKKTEIKENVKTQLDDIAGRAGLLTTTISIIVFTLIMLFSSSSFWAIFSLIALIYLIINQIIIYKTGYSSALFLVSLFLTLGIYPFVRLIITLGYFIGNRSTYSGGYANLYFNGR